MAETAEIKTIPVEDLYTRWGDDYDNRGLNNMQVLDDVEMTALLPKFLSLIQVSHSAPDLKIIDFACGTGRTTLKLVTVPSATIIGLDATPKLLEIARRRCQERLASLPQDARAADVRCEVYNPLVHPKAPECALNAVGLVSTLAIEHFTLPEFFEATSKLLKSGGFLIASNMHPELLRIAHGSIIDKKTGELLWGVSHIYSAEDVQKEAPKWGFELVEVQEGMPRDPNLEGPMRGQWEGIKCWIGFLLKKK